MHYLIFNSVFFSELSVKSAAYFDHVKATRGILVSMKLMAMVLSERCIIVISFNLKWFEGMEGASMPQTWHLFSC